MISQVLTMESPVKAKVMVAVSVATLPISKYTIAKEHEFTSIILGLSKTNTHYVGLCFGHILWELQPLKLSEKKGLLG